MSGLPFGLDALVVLLLVVARMPWLAESLTWDVAPALTLLGFAYLLLDVEARRRLRPGACAEPSAGVTRLKLLCLWAIASAYVVLPTIRLIALRHGSAPWTYVHDNVIQTEEAMKFLLLGKNPYATDYLDTVLVRWEPDNPALYHYINLPFQLLLGLPFARVANATLGWFDLRMAYLFFFVATMAIVPRIARDRETGLTLFAVVALNPLFSRCQVEGRNDIVVLWALLTAIYAAQRGRSIAAAIFLGLAWASKHTAWVATPFVWMLLRPDAGQRGAEIRRTVRRLAPAAAVASLLILPFVFWDPLAFYRSVLGYPTGGVAHSYPIRGDGAYGFGTWVLSWGLVATDRDPFPFWIFQLLFGMPCLLYMLRWLARERTLRTALIGYAITLFVLQFFSRYFNQNHLGFILTLLAVGVLGRDSLGEATTPAA